MNNDQTLKWCLSILNETVQNEFKDTKDFEYFDSEFNNLIKKGFSNISSERIKELFIKLEEYNDNECFDFYGPILKSCYEKYLKDQRIKEIKRDNRKRRLEKNGK